MWNIAPSPIVVVFLLVNGSIMVGAQTNEEWACMKSTWYWSASCQGKPRQLLVSATIPSEPMCVDYENPYDSEGGSIEMYCDLETGTYISQSYMGSSECVADESHVMTVENQESGFCVGTMFGGFVTECSKGPCDDDAEGLLPSTADLIQAFENQQVFVSRAKYATSVKELESMFDAAAGAPAQAALS